ncbi:MAG: anaerobic ribonucleoside-triphosphate reductase [Promethearchaeota archaeon]|nr:MAG: anaerobic ribonucleoside-triphosphate reductase [Candidatus Lokiarchaeota archaeon]
MHLLPKVFRTEDDVSDFEPTKIFESIIKETGMKEEDAKNITELAVRRIISSGIKFLSGPHIREIVCSILSEQHFEEERKLYTRIGMPLMDYEEILEKWPKTKPGETINPEKIHHWAANQLSEEYTLLRILGDDESRAHLYGDIHIHKLKYFDLRPLSQSWDPRMILKNGLPPALDWKICGRSGPAEDFRHAVHHLAKWLGMTQGEFSGSQGFNFITTFLAPYAKGLKDHEIKKGVYDLIFEINQLTAVIGRDTPITSISCTPGILEELAQLSAVGPNGKTKGIYKDYHEECMKLFNLITDIFIQGDYYGTSFNYPKHIIYVRKDWLENNKEIYSKIWEEINKGKIVYIVNLCSDWVKNEIKDQYSGDKYFNLGTLQNISLNLPRYAYLGKDQDKFTEILNEKMNLSAFILHKKYNIIKKRLKSKHLPLCSSSIINHESIFNLERQNLAFNYVGLNEAVKYLTNYELHENSDAFNLGKKIVREMMKIATELGQKDSLNYIIQENLSNKVLMKFERLDLKHFPDTTHPLVKEQNIYYTNSAHFRKDIQIDLIERIRKQGEFHEIMRNGRNIENIWLKQIEIKYTDLFELIRIICESSKIACVKFSS